MTQVTQASTRKPAKKSTFVEIHVLKSFPPSCLNRDDLGRPKMATFGQVARLRISSQCLKRAVRTSRHFVGEFAEQQLGVRTARLFDELVAPYAEDKDMRAGLLTLLSSFGRKDKADPKGGTGEGDDEAPADGQAADGQPAQGAEGDAAPADAEAAGAGDEPVDERTAHLLYLTRQEIEEAGRFVAANAKQVAGLLKKGGKKGPKVDAAALKALRAGLREHLRATTTRNAVDVGLAGRFITSDEIDTVHGALDLAHAIGVHRCEVEPDFFTAVDDLSGRSGHLGESELASSVVYMFASVDLEKLAENLGRREAGKRVADDESRRLARAAMPVLTQALAEVVPTGKHTSTAPHTVAEYVEVVFRHDAPISLVDGFLKPVDQREGGGDTMLAAIDRLVAQRSKLEAAYDRKPAHRFVMCLKNAILGDGASEVKSIAELREAIASAMGDQPAEAAS